MMKLLPLAVLAVAVAAQDKPADKPAQDKPADNKTYKDRLQGVVAFATLEINGKEIKGLDPENFAKSQKEHPGAWFPAFTQEDLQWIGWSGAELTFKNDDLVIVLKASPEKDKAKFTLDPDKPRSIDVKLPTIDAKDQVEKAGVWRILYELQGDTLRLCMGTGSTERPKEFTSKGGQVIVTLTREKDDEMDWLMTKTLATACERYKLKHLFWPQTLDALAQRGPNGDQAMIDAAALKPRLGKAFSYNPYGPKNKGLHPDIWVEGPNGPIGNWMKEPPEENKDK